ncbi:MAG TPA: hypothetical protein VLJ38_05520 [Polyangiaceae bacterium]|nr:hypothetical protein [Polyangiaceae bacterium]
MKLGLKVAIPVLIGFSLATGTLSAQTPPAVTDTAIADAVELKDGTFLRGLIIEVEPASHVSLRLPDGQVRRISVENVKSAERGGKPLELGAASTASPSATPLVAGAAAATPPSAGPAAPGASPAPTVGGPEPGSDLGRVLAAIPGPRIRLEAQANRSAFLERRIGDADEDVVAYHLVCKVPCSVELPAADPVPYRIGYGRFQPTNWFTLPKYSARVKADLASDMYTVWTRSMLVGGFVFGAVGGSIYGINEATGKKPWAHDTGLVLLGLSGACFLTSGLFWLFSPHTTYTIERTP